MIGVDCHLIEHDDHADHFVHHDHDAPHLLVLFHCYVIVVDGYYWNVVMPFDYDYEILIDYLNFVRMSTNENFENSMNVAASKNEKSDDCFGYSAANDYHLS